MTDLDLGEHLINHSEADASVVDGKFNTITTLINTTGVPKVQDGIVGTSALVDQSVTAAKLADASVDVPGKLGSDVVIAAKIAAGAVTAPKLAAGAAASNIGDGGVTEAMLADAIVTSEKLAANATSSMGVDSDKPTASSVPAGFIYFSSDVGGGTLYRSDGTSWTQISNGITSATVADSSITSAKIVNGTIQNEDYGDGSITVGKFSAALQQCLVPMGAMLDFGLTAAQVPDGFVPCDGSAVTVASGNTSLRDALIAAGNPYGVSGSDPRVPDTRGKVTAGKAASGTFGTLGQGSNGTLLGVESANIGVNELPAHTHAVSTSASYTPSGSVSATYNNPANHNDVWTGATTGGGSGFTSGSQRFNLSSLGHAGSITSWSFTGSAATINASGSAAAITSWTGQTALSRIQPTVVVNKIMKT